MKLEESSVMTKENERFDPLLGVSSHVFSVRIRYSAAAERGAILFFVVASLSAISSMYEYSLRFSFQTVKLLIYSFQCIFGSISSEFGEICTRCSPRKTNEECKSFFIPIQKLFFKNNVKYYCRFRTT